MLWSLLDKVAAAQGLMLGSRSFIIRLQRPALGQQHGSQHIQAQEILSISLQGATKRGHSQPLLDAQHLI